MMSSNEIQSRQNEERLLKIQYAARRCYNTAEKINNYVWLLCLIAAFSVFFPETWSVFLNYGVPFVADIVTVCLMFLVNHKVKTGAQLRRYFDAYVLNICPDAFSETEFRKIKEISGKIYSENSAIAEIHMRNTGHDHPPGVYEWYVFPKHCFGVSAQFECQRQNTWWNSKMSSKRLVITICAAILIAAGFVLLMVNGEILTIILCSAGLIIKIAERLIENWKYIKVSVQIDGAQQTIESCPTKEGVAKLQNFIDKRRSIVVLEFNWLHKKSADVLSKEYEDSIL